MLSLLFVAILIVILYFIYSQAKGASGIGCLLLFIAVLFGLFLTEVCHFSFWTAVAILLFVELLFLIWSSKLPPQKK